MTAEDITLSSLCLDCGIPCWPFEQFMVRDPVWREAGDERGDLCVECLQGRLGRELERGDFPPLPINDDREVDSVRLRLAKGSGRRTEPLYALATTAVQEFDADVDSAAAMLGLSAGLLETWVEHGRSESEVLDAA